MTLFADIMRDAVQTTPGAVGGAFADSEGEMVDSFSTLDKHEWAVLTAHYGVVLAHLHSCFGTWHYGGPEYFIAQHAKVDVIVHTIAHGYFALLAVEENAGTGQLGPALISLRAACEKLRKEIA